MESRITSRGSIIASLIRLESRGSESVRFELDERTVGREIGIEIGTKILPINRETDTRSSGDPKNSQRRPLIKKSQSRRSLRGRRDKRHYRVSRGPSEAAGRKKFQSRKIWNNDCRVRSFSANCASVPCADHAGTASFAATIARGSSERLHCPEKFTAGRASAR